MGSIPGTGRSPGGEHGNPFQYSCLENPMARGAWWATVHGVTKSRTGLKWLSMHSHPGLNGKLHHYLGPDGEARRRFLLRSRRKFWKSFPDSKGEGLEKNEGPLRRSWPGLRMWPWAQAVAVAVTGREEPLDQRLIDTTLELAIENSRQITGLVWAARGTSALSEGTD